MGKPQKYSYLFGPQARIFASLDTVTSVLSTNHVTVTVSGVGKKITVANFVDGLTGTVTTTGLNNAAGVINVDIVNCTGKTTPVAADAVMINDSSDDSLKKATLTNLAKPLADVMAGTASATGLTDSAGVLTVAAKIAHLEAALLKGVSNFTMSFETGEQTTTRIYFPMKVTIDKIRGIVMKAIAATDNGTITCGNSTGASTAGVITATASDALNTEYSVSPSTNNVVLADGYYYLTSAKSTAGGRILVSLEWTRTA
jgi:hypothetical protein